MKILLESLKKVIGLRRMRSSEESEEKVVTKKIDLDLPSIPMSQQALLLHRIQHPYQLTDIHPVPCLMKDEEVLIKTHVIGLNPIDWKAPDFNFGIPELPFISGRELVGEVVKLRNNYSRLKHGDRVIAISTDYRDLRKATFQEYVVATGFNVCRIPPTLSSSSGATIGVAFVAATLALGICMGVDFGEVLNGPDLLKTVHSLREDTLPRDIRSECLEGIHPKERAKRGDWIVIWGGSSTSANLTTQLARLIGMRIILVVDKCKHGLRLSSHPTLRPDLLIDDHDSERAVAIIRSATKGKLRFALDTRGRESAKLLLNSLGPMQENSTNGHNLPSPPPTPPINVETQAHLVGLTGLPKGEPPKGVLFHAVPIKLFHEVQSIGNAIVFWLERLLSQELIVAPDVIFTANGLQSINHSLDKMRKGEIAGGKAVISLE